MAARVVPFAVPAHIQQRLDRTRARRAAIAAPRRPAIPVFVAGRVNRCPDCHSEAFTVGRITAECGGCGLPLPIVSFRRVS